MGEEKTLEYGLKVCVGDKGLSDFRTVAWPTVFVKESKHWAPGVAERDEGQRQYGGSRMKHPN